MQKDADFLQGDYRYVAVTINPRGIILLSDSHTNRLARNLILDLVGSPLSNFVHKMLGMVQVSAGLITVQSRVSMWDLHISIHHVTKSAVKRLPNGPHSQQNDRGPILNICSESTAGICLRHESGICLRHEWTHTPNIHLKNSEGSSTTKLGWVFLERHAGCVVEPSKPPVETFKKSQHNRFHVSGAWNVLLRTCSFAGLLVRFARRWINVTPGSIAMQGLLSLFPLRNAKPQLFCSRAHIGAKRFRAH